MVVCRIKQQMDATCLSRYKLSSSMQDAKRAAARAALNEIPDHGNAVVGLGSGSTARVFVEELGERVRAGLRIVGVPTSKATRELAESAGIPLLEDDGPWDIHVNVDGADEVSEALDSDQGWRGRPRARKDRELCLQAERHHRGRDQAIEASRGAMARAHRGPPVRTPNDPWPSCALRKPDPQGP